jgi:hypothetical protein
VVLIDEPAYVAPAAPEPDPEPAPAPDAPAPAAPAPTPAAPPQTGDAGMIALVIVMAAGIVVFRKQTAK